MTEEQSNINKANDLFKFANKLDPNSFFLLEIEWYMQIIQNRGVQQCLNVLNFCKPFLLKVLLIMKNVNDIVNIATYSESNALAQFTSDTSIDISSLIVNENSEDNESNESKETNKYTTVHNESAETSSKRQKLLCSLTPGNKNIKSATLNNGATCSYTVLANILTDNLKEYADRNWGTNVTNQIMPNVKIPLSRKIDMRKVFKFQKNNLEYIFFNARGLNSKWFTKDGISATISF